MPTARRVLTTERRALGLSLAMLLLLVAGATTSSAAATSPLGEPGWHLVAHMSNDGGMFDGDGDLAPDYHHGTFVAAPTASTPDFQRAFPVVADQILFITGNGDVWAIADYNDLRALIDAKAGAINGRGDPNLAFETSEGGTMGHVLSRSGNAEDPWISINGGHFDGIDNSRIVWGEKDYSAGTHQALKNSHFGINVYVRAAVPSEKAECKRGGWQEVARPDGSAFKNQGDCVSFVASQGRR